MNPEVIKVKFVCSQEGNCEDIFKGIGNYRYYSRHENGNWGTSSKWSGGFERDCSLKNDIVIEVYDNDKNLLFTETSQNASNDNYPFYWRVGENLKSELVSKYSLISHDEWRNHLVSKQKEFNNTGYADNWVYSQETINTIVLEEIEFYGKKFQVIEEECSHKTCALKWKEYQLKSVADDTCHLLYGYKFQ